MTTLSTPTAIFCEEHGWSFALSWEAGVYKTQCGCDIKYRLQPALSKKDYTRLKNAVEQGRSNH